MSEKGLGQKAFTYRQQEGGGFIVMHCGERLGFVLEAAPSSWCATDTFMQNLRGRYATRALAAGALLRRVRKEASHGHR